MSGTCLQLSLAGGSEPSATFKMERRQQERHLSWDKFCKNTQEQGIMGSSSINETLSQTRKEESYWGRAGPSYREASHIPNKVKNKTTHESTYISLQDPCQSCVVQGTWPQPKPNVTVMPKQHKILLPCTGLCQAASPLQRAATKNTKGRLQGTQIPSTS